MEGVRIYANSHYITPGPTIQQAMGQIKEDLKNQIAHFEENGQLLEAQRINQRTTFDLEMLAATGTCQGIENYSRWLSGRNPGEPPPTLFEYLPENALLFVDESHVAVPQIGGMYRGDYNRKFTLAEHGFRLALQVVHAAQRCDGRHQNAVTVQIQGERIEDFLSITVVSADL